MSQLVKAENGSCLQLYKKQRKLHEDMCPPCLFLASKDRNYHKVHNNATVGICYLLYPRLAPEAVEQDEGQDNNNNNTNNEALGRPIGRPDLFVAEPSNSAKMQKDRTIHPRRRERMRRFGFRNLDVMSQCQEVAKEVENNPKFLQTLLENYPELAKPAVDPVVQALKQSVGGKRKLMEAITGKENISLPRCGASKAAKNKRIKTSKELKTGLKQALGTPVIKALCRLPLTPATPATPVFCFRLPLTPATAEKRAPLHPNVKLQQRAKGKRRVSFRLEAPPMAPLKPVPLPVLPKSIVNMPKYPLQEHPTAPSSAEVPPSFTPPNSKALQIITESPASEFENPSFVDSPPSTSPPVGIDHLPLDPMPREQFGEGSPTPVPPAMDTSSLAASSNAQTPAPLLAMDASSLTANPLSIRLTTDSTPGLSLLDTPMMPHTPARTLKDVPTKKMSRRKRNPSSSAKKRRKSKKLDLQQEALQAEIGDLVLNHVATLSQPRERRPWLAAGAARGHQKKTVEAVFGINICHHEWHNITIHAVYPGPFVEAPRKVFSRNKVNKDILVKMLRFLDLPGNLQKYAFGRKIVALFNRSSYAELDNVARMKKLVRIAAEFVCALSAELDNINLSAEPGVASMPESDKRCQHLEGATFRRCMCPRGHTSENHKFTPKGSICMSTAMELIDSLTSGLG
jgi:hypothetical protein